LEDQGIRQISYIPRTCAGKSLDSVDLTFLHKELVSRRAGRTHSIDDLRVVL
jgi:hypothetical protein